MPDMLYLDINFKLLNPRNLRNIFKKKKKLRIFWEGRSNVMVSVTIFSLKRSLL